MCNQDMDNGSIKLKPVGSIRNGFRFEDWKTEFSTLPWQEKITMMEEQRVGVSEIVVDESLEGILDGIEEYSHLMVLFWGHQMPDEKRLITRVHPLGSPEFPLVGIFATHSPVRPNPVLMTVVKLLERKGNVLRVSGLDAMDGSPLLDIKPYINYYEETKNMRMPGWMRQLQNYFSREEGTDAADKGYFNTRYFLTDERQV